MIFKIPEKFLWALQRLSALFLLTFFIWFVISIYNVELQSYSETLKWIKTDYNSLLLFLFSITIVLHANLGLSVIIEDYVHASNYKKFFYFLKSILVLFCMLFSGICLYFI